MDRPFSLVTRSYSAHAARQTPPSKVGTSSVELLNLFLAFQLLDQICLPILVATFMLSSSVKRHPTVVNVCLTWILTGFFSSLLLYAGKQVGPEPSAMLCASQAALLSGVPPMTSVAIFALIYQVYLNITRPTAEALRLRTYVGLIMPYLSFFAFAISAAILAAGRPESVGRARRFFYCSLDSPVSNAFAIFSGLTLLATLGYAVAITVFLKKNSRELRQSGQLDLQFLVRVGLFVVYVFIALILSVLSIFSPSNPFPDLFTASVGTALFLILASQQDVYRVWLRRPRPPQQGTIQVDNRAVEDEEKAYGGKLQALTAPYASGGEDDLAQRAIMHDITAQLNALRDKSPLRSEIEYKLPLDHHSGENGDNAAFATNGGIKSKQGDVRWGGRI